MFQNFKKVLGIIFFSIFVFFPKLTLAANPLYVDETNQRVGIGTTSPQAKLVECLNEAFEYRVPSSFVWGRKQILHVNRLNYPEYVVFYL